MPTPIHRYSVPKAGVSDAALFAFAYGTNPEVIVAIEYRDQPGDISGWSFAFAPVTTAALEATLDGRRMWTKPPLLQSPGWDEPYVHFSKSAEE